MFMSIREAAKRPEIPYSEYMLRKMVHQGKIPGIYSGKKFLVNGALLLQMIDAQCAAEVSK